MNQARARGYWCERARLLKNTHALALGARIRPELSTTPLAARRGIAKRAAQSAIPLELLLPAGVNALDQIMHGACLRLIRRQPAPGSLLAQACLRGVPRKHATHRGEAGRPSGRLPSSRSNLRFDSNCLRSSDSICSFGKGAGHACAWLRTTCPCFLCTYRMPTRSRTKTCHPSAHQRATRKKGPAQITPPPSRPATVRRLRPWSGSCGLRLRRPRHPAAPRTSSGCPGTA